MLILPIPGLNKKEWTMKAWFHSANMQEALMVRPHHWLLIMHLSQNMGKKKRDGQPTEPFRKRPSKMTYALLAGA